MVSSDSDSSTNSHTRDRKRRKYDNDRKDGAEEKQKKSSSSNSSSRKHDKDRDSSRSKKDSKKSRKKDRKKESKSSKTSKKSKKEKKHKKKRKHSDSDSSSDESDSSSDSSSSSRSRSRSRSHSRKHPSSSSSAAAAPIPTPAPTSVTRALGLIDTLLTHGGGDKTAAGREVQFLLFKLDSGSNVNVEAIGDPLVKHILSTLFREMGLKVKIDPATGEEGWMSPVDSRGRVAYKLCDLLSNAFKTEAEKQSNDSAAPSIGPSMPPPRDSSTSSSVGPIEAPSSARVVGPAMPNAEDFDRMARGETAALAEEDDEEEGGNFGPRLPEQLTDQERVAFDRLRASREQLASLRTAVKEGEKSKDGGREEWMTAMPTFDNSMPSTAVIAALAASGDRDAMKGRGFATKNAGRTLVQDDEWALSPAERARKDAERAAIRLAEKAVYQSSVSAGGKGGEFSAGSDSSGGRREGANSSAAAAQAANDRMMARYQAQQTLTSNSLMARYQKEEELKRTKDKSKPDGLFRWDHDKEMGMRGIKGKEALKKELNNAYQLNDSFAPAGSQ